MNTMKFKLFSILQIILLTMIIKVPVCYSSSEYWIPGDANNDGEVNIVDALLVSQAYVDNNTEEIYMLNSDVNGDLSITIIDALLIAQYYVNSITVFPIETDIYEFADQRIEAAAKTSLSKFPEDKLTIWDLRCIQSLSVKGSSIPLENLDLTDIQQMMGLSELAVNNYALHDLSPLSQLGIHQTPLINSDVSGVTPPHFYKYLISLDLNNTDMSDITMLNSLTRVKELVVSNNQISDFNPLANCIDLTFLDLDNTGIGSLDPLSSLINLEYLNLNNNGLSNAAQLPNLVSLKDLKIRNNEIGNNGFEAISNLDSLLTLDISGNNISDVTIYNESDNFTLLQILDIRDNPLSYADLKFKFNMKKLDIFSCNPGNFKGDANGDGAITSEDVDMVNAIQSYYGPNSNYFFEPPDNIEYIDMNNNKIIDNSDVTILNGMISSGPGDIVGFFFNNTSIKGDVDGDGTVALDDVNLLTNLPSNIVNVSSDITCVDMNGDGALNETDGEMIRAIAKNREPLVVLDKELDSDVVSIVTYDYDYNRWHGTEGSDAAAKTPYGAIDELHKNILSNPFLSKTDIILMSEFAYADFDNPVELMDNGKGKHPRYSITNSNWIVDKVKELMKLAIYHKINIVVSFVERLYFNNCPVSFNSALVINTQGHIEYVRRKTYKILSENPPAGIEDSCLTTSNNSYEIMELTNRKNELFTAILIICSEMNDVDDLDPTIAEVIDNYLEDKDKNTIDFLLFIENQFQIHPPAANLMKRIQTDAWDPDGDFYVFKKPAVYRDIVDFMAYSGGLKNSQGVYNMNKQPIESIYTNQFDNSGFIFSRVKLIRSQQ